VTVHAGVGHRIKGENDGYMNVEITAPTDDIGESEGLCGSFDGDETNDFIGNDGSIYDESNKTDFIRSWM